MNLGHDALKARQRRERGEHPEGLALRVHRALSWLHAAEQSSDEDGRLIFLWIAFNAAYANDFGDRERPQERELFEKFLGKLVELDRDDTLYNLIWSEFSGSIRLLLDNRFVFQPFWDFHNGKLAEPEWQADFKQANDAARHALGSKNTLKILSIVLSRMYTLRNQLIHGGATWQGAVNRDQLRDCSAFLGKLVPYVIRLMMDHPNTLWGRACYPVVEADCAACSCPPQPRAFEPGLRENCTCGCVHDKQGRQTRYYGRRTNRSSARRMSRRRGNRPQPRRWI